jgi:hypothetical protein
MDYIEFENSKVPKIQVEPKDYKTDEEINNLSLIKGECLLNSFKVAEFIKCKMAEGFLITKYKNKPLECVAHVWNKIGDQYIDFTLPLKKHSEEILSNSYYIVEEYDSKDKSVEVSYTNGNNFSIFPRNDAPPSTLLIFKTKVKEKEKELLIKLREAEVKNKSN